MEAYRYRNINTALQAVCYGGMISQIILFIYDGAVRTLCEDDDGNWYKNCSNFGAGEITKV